MPSSHHSWLAHANDDSVRSGSAVSYPYTPVPPSDGLSNLSTLPPDLFEAEPLQSPNTQRQPSTVGALAYHEKRQSMLRPTYKVLKAECISNARVFPETLESGQEITVFEPTMQSDTVDGYFITKWSPFGKLQAVDAYAIDPDADPDGQYPRPVIDLGSVYPRNTHPGFDSRGALITLVQFHKPCEPEGTEHGSDNTDVIPWAIRALDPSRPNIMPEDWQQTQSDAPTEHFPIRYHPLPNSNSSPPGSALSSVILPTQLSD